MPTRTAPRSFLVHPDKFGRSSGLEWKTVSPEFRVALVEAAIQHEIAFAVNEDLQHNARDLHYLAVRVDENVNYLRRRLHGEVRAGLEQYISWAIHLGVHILTPRLAPQNLSELFPAQTILPDTQLRLA